MPHTFRNLILPLGFHVLALAGHMRESAGGQAMYSTDTGLRALLFGLFSKVPPDRRLWPMEAFFGAPAFSKKCFALFAVLLPVLILFGDQALWSQQSTSAQPQSDPQALAVVQQAITAMGGTAAWQQVGGATAQSIISRKNLPARTVKWTDDWSTGRVRFRRDKAANDSTLYDPASEHRSPFL